MFTGLSGKLTIDYENGKPVLVFFRPSNRGAPNVEFDVRRATRTADNTLQFVEAERGSPVWMFEREVARRAPPAPRPPPGRRTSRKPRRVSKRRRSPPERKDDATPRSQNLDEQDALALAHKLLADWDVAGYKVTFSNRMTRSAGLTYFGRNRREIRFSGKIWRVLTNAQRREVVHHEVAHAAHCFDNEEGCRGAPHGREWKRIMKDMGYPHAQARYFLSADQRARLRGYGLAANGVSVCAL